MNVKTDRQGKASAEPYYKQLANHLTQNLTSGLWSVGATLPTEKDLCEQFGVSRHTVREALRVLENQGLIARRQGSGSVVLALTPPVRYEQNTQTIEDMLHHGNATRLHVLSAEKVAGDTNQYSAQIDQIAGKPCVLVRAIRYPRNDVRPLALVDVYVAVCNRAQEKRLLDLQQTAQEIVTTVQLKNVDRIDQSFRAINASTTESKLLHVPANDAVFQIVRRYHDKQGALIVVAHSLYNGSLFTYASTLHST